MQLNNNKITDLKQLTIDLPLVEPKDIFSEMTKKKMIKNRMSKDF